jgi:ABC-type Fe3+/spermidine/putrescine transport system ATPase subunit
MSANHFSSQAVRLDRVTARYGAVTALDNISLTLPAGEVLALLGPSGCGKSTLLRSIAGFAAHDGDIYVGDKVISSVKPHHRNIGMVFQDYALFPHMTVAENVGFGLKMRRVARHEIAVQVSETLRLVGLEGFETRMARQLSGGQQQRVALARALVVKPAILLLDEPLSALDKKLREEMRSELKRIQGITKVTTIFVTHDQDEALGLADRLALMSRGTVLQVGTPEDVYRHPVSPFVAEFLGAANTRNAICRSADADSVLLEIPSVGALRAKCANGKFSVGDRVNVFVRPERISLLPRDKEGTFPSLPATVAGQIYLGRHTEVTLRLGDGSMWVANIGDDSSSTKMEVGANLSIQIEPQHVMVYAAADH